MTMEQWMHFIHAGLAPYFPLMLAIVFAVVVWVKSADWNWPELIRILVCAGVPGLILWMTYGPGAAYVAYYLG